MSRSPPLDMLNMMGIQGICWNISLTLTKSHMADNPIYLFSLGTLSIEIKETVFVSQTSGSAHLGGLSIQSYSFVKVKIDQCTFANLKYDDMAHTLMGSLLNVPAALRIELKSSNYRSYHSPSTSAILPDPHISLSSSMFENNLRAVAITSPNEGFLAKGLDTTFISITNCTFVNNQISTSGAGVFINSPHVDVTISLCAFGNNRAGENPLYEAVQHAEVKLTTTSTLTLFSYEINSEGVLINIQYHIGSYKTENKTISCEIKGNGGAIAVQSARTIFIAECSFLNNSANSLGASIFLNDETHRVAVKDTSFFSGDISASLKGGLFLYSSCKKLTFTHVNFTVLETIPGGVSAVTHNQQSNNAGVMSMSLDIDSVTVTCPERNRLSLQNSSSETDILYLYSMSFERPVWAYETFGHLVFTCAPCQVGYYTMGKGYLHQHREVQSLRTKRSVANASDIPSTAAPPIPPPPPPVPPDHPPVPGMEAVISVYQYEDVVCHRCPYGGHCNNDIQSKANYWGVETGDQVEFYLCPNGYCCSELLCPTYNTCSQHRKGTMCCKCEPGFSEALFSTHCVPNEKCNQFWVVPLMIILMLFSGVFLIFQNDFESFLSHSSQPRQNNRSQQIVPQAANNNYFQDADLVHFTPIYAKATDPLLKKLVKFAGGLFDFNIDVSVFTDNVCPFPNREPTVKIWLLLLPIPVLLIILFAFFMIFKHTALCFSVKTLENLKSNTLAAFLLAILFSYQNIASSLFSLVYCTPFLKESVLFYDADIMCFQNWQIIILFFISFGIIPFGIFLTIVPMHLQKKSITLQQFYCGCFCPLPVMVWLLLAARHRNCKPNAQKQDSVTQEATSQIYETLQGPYKLYSLSWCHDVHLCWSGIVVLERLTLVLIFTYIHNVMVRLLCMTLVCFFTLLCHLIVQPCKVKKDNWAGTISHSALFLICLINLVRANFEVAEVIPEGQAKNILDILQLVEELMLLWIPLVGACALIILLLWKLLGVLRNKCTKGRQTSVTCVS